MRWEEPKGAARGEEEGGCVWISIKGPLNALYTTIYNQCSQQHALDWMGRPLSPSPLPVFFYLLVRCTATINIELGRRRRHLLKRMLAGGPKNHGRVLFFMLFTCQRLPFPLPVFCLYIPNTCLEDRLVCGVNERTEAGAAVNICVHKYNSHLECECGKGDRGNSHSPRPPHSFNRNRITLIGANMQPSIGVCWLWVLQISVWFKILSIWQIYCS